MQYWLGWSIISIVYVPSSPCPFIARLASGKSSERLTFGFAFAVALAPFVAKCWFYYARYPENAHKLPRSTIG